jgi:uncharacterized membrane protein
MSLLVSSETKSRPIFDPAEMGAIAHLYRGEVYRSTIWRTRLDNTTNWAIVTMGIALSTTFSSPEASPLPLMLVGLLIAVFLGMEARRYRYFNVWRARARWLEVNFYAPIFSGEARDNDWQAMLAHDYTAPRHHISFLRAVGRRLRRNYVWILLVQAIAYYGKIAIHPSAATSLAEFTDRAARGPDPRLARLVGGLRLQSRLARFRTRHDVARPAPARPAARGCRHGVKHDPEKWIRVFRKDHCLKKAGGMRSRTLPATPG